MEDKKALIVVKSDPPAGKEIEWNEWYIDKHVGPRIEIPGFLFIRRFIAVDAKPKYLNLYDLTKATVLTSEPYIKLRKWELSQPPDKAWSLPNSSRGLYEQIFPERGEYKPPESQFVLITGHDALLNKEEEFNDWFIKENLPAMLRIHGLLTARGFTAFKVDMLPQIGPWAFESKYFAVYDISNEKVLQSPEFKKVTNSLWTSIHAPKFRGIYRRIYPKPE